MRETCHDAAIKKIKPLEYTHEMDFVTRRFYNPPSDGVWYPPPYLYTP